MALCQLGILVGCPTAALPRLPLDLGELPYADCLEDAGAEVPGHLEAGVIGLWSAGGEGWGMTGCGEPGVQGSTPRFPQPWGLPPESPLQLTGAGPLQWVTGRPGAAGRC